MTDRFDDEAMNNSAASNNSVVESEEMRMERLSRQLDALVGSIPNFRRIRSSEVIDNSAMERLSRDLEWLKADIAEEKAAKIRRERAEHERQEELRKFETLTTFHMLVDDESTHTQASSSRIC